MISRSSIQEVQQASRVEEIVQEYVNLKRRGVNMIGLCPFHDEKTPSFTVSPTKNLFKCFGCGKGGDATKFLMEHEQLSFPEAIRFLAQRYNIELDEGTPEDKKKYEEEKKLQDSLYIINDFANKHFVESLANNSIASSYFKERGYIQATIDRFDLGFADGDFKSLYNKIKANTFKMEFAQKIGLVTQKENDFFINRVMFPIHNLSGKVIAFGGRVLKTQEKSPKYLNSPESEIYHKRHILYGIFQAKQAIRKKDSCIIVEGYTDVLSMFQNGVENVVASSGTALTSQQIRLVKRFTDNVIILYDGDQAGIKAALRGLDLVLEQDMNVRLVVLPEGQDPDSFIKSQGQSEFENYLSNESQDFIIFKTNLLLDESGDDPVKKANVLKDIISSLARIRDTIKRSLYIKQCSQLLDIYENILIKEVNKTIRNNIVSREKEQAREKAQAERSAGTKAQGSLLEPPPIVEGEFPAHDPYAELQDVPEEKIDHKKFFPAKFNDEYQEKDIIRILMMGGANSIPDYKIDEETRKANPENHQISMAVYIFEHVKDMLDHFENELYKNLIVEAFERSERDQDISTQFYVSHENPDVKELALELLTSPHEYASWTERGVMLQTQSMPEENHEKDGLSAIDRVLTRKIEKVLDQLEIRLANTNVDSEDRMLFLKAAMEIQKQKIAIMSRQGSIGIRKI